MPGPSPGMQPVALQSLSELERASLQELALFWLQERLLVGHLRLDRGTGGTGWDRRDRREGRGGKGWDRREGRERAGGEAPAKGAEAEPFMPLTPAPQPGMMVMERHL